MNDWEKILKPVKINPEQMSSILKGKAESYSGKLRLYKIFGEVPSSLWQVRHTEKLDLKDQSQHNVSQEHRNDTLKTFDSSTRNQNVRWKGAISMFPRKILEQLLDFYTQPGDRVLDLTCGHNSRLEPTFMRGRHYTGVDISKPFMVFNEQVKTKLLKEHPEIKCEINLHLGDSRYIKLPENYYDFHFTSPPFYSIEDYGDEPEQLGKLGTYGDFMGGMLLVYKNIYKSLKPGKFNIINVNDFRLNGKYYTYHTDTINALKEAGFTMYDFIVMKYSNAMRSCFPNQIWEEKLLPKIQEFLIVTYKAPNYPHSVVYPFKKKVL